MISDPVIERLREGNVLLDGAMGTMLIARGLLPGRPPEEWNRDRPSVVRRVHSSYLDAGSEVIETNTFGGTRSRLRGFGLDAAADELNTAGVMLAEEAVADFASGSPDDSTERAGSGATSAGRARRRFIAVSIGPTGKFFPPVGTASESEIAEEFVRQIEGIRAGFDLVVIETMIDVKEALAALAAVKGSSKAPVAVTLTFNRNPRGFYTIMGDEAGRAVRRLEDAGADAVGANCSIESGPMTELGELLRGSTDLPVVCQPNAGSPRLEKGTAVYDQPPTEFARDALRLFGMGINAVGGCCGTTPEFIREVAAAMSQR